MAPRADAHAGYVASRNDIGRDANPLDGAVKYIVIDFSSVNDIDVSGGVMIGKTIEYLEARFQVRVLLASVKGSVRDALWRSAGRIEMSNEVDVIPAEEVVPDDSVVGIEDTPKPVIVSDRFFLGVSYAVDFAKRKMLK